jgi:phytanoyl-CoA hydroxylase
VVFSSLTPHRTGPNRTGEVRKAYILQYAPEGACVLEPGSGRKIRQDDVERQFPVLVAGVAVGG